MEIEPAHIDQLQQAADGRWVLIDADIGGVAADLQAIDPELKVRYSEISDVYVVRREWYDGDGRRNEQLVLSCKDLDQRVVERIREIDSQGRGGYDFAREVEAQNRRAEKARQDRFHQKMGELGEQAAHAVRKDIGATNRAFISRGIES